MGRDFLYIDEVLSEALRCPKCGSKHIRIYGERNVDFESVLESNKVVKDTQGKINSEIVFDIACEECDYVTDADDVSEWRVLRKEVFD